MSWIKRNLYFVVFGVVAVALLGLAGFYFYSKSNLNRTKLTELETAYSDWERIARGQSGNRSTNNIENARQEKVRAENAINRVKRFFAPIPPVPNPESGQISNFDFISALRRTTSQLEREAANHGVKLNPQYGFSFEAQRNLFTIAPGSLNALAGQLGDIKVITTILFQAKINSLDNIRRERVSSDDLSGPQSDYLEATHTSITNDLAILTPYEVTFQCFSTELAAVLTGFGSAPYGFIVKAINVAPSGADGASTTLGTPYAAGGDIMMRPETERVRPTYPGNNPYNLYQPYGAQPAPVQPVARGGLQTVLDEKQLKVTLVLNVVRLLPKE